MTRLAAALDAQGDLLLNADPDLGPATVTIHRGDCVWWERWADVQRNCWCLPLIVAVNDPRFAETVEHFDMDQ